MTLSLFETRALCDAALLCSICICALWIQSGQTDKVLRGLRWKTFNVHDHSNSTHHSVCLGEGAHHGWYVCVWLWRELSVICGRCGLVLEILNRNTEVKY